MGYAELATAKKVTFNPLVFDEESEAMEKENIINCVHSITDPIWDFPNY